MADHAWIPIRVPVLVVDRLDASTLPEADVHVATWFATVLPVVNARRARKVFHFSQGYEALYPYVAHLRDEIDAAYAAPVPKLLISRHLEAHLAPRFPGPFHVLPQTLRADAYRPEVLRPGARTPASIGVVGPFELSIKGIETSLHAIARLRAEGRKVRVHRASQMGLTPEERALLVPDVYAYRASVDEMIRWYRELDLLLFASSDEEGFGLPPLEAMASGVPVVTTAIPSLDVLPEEAVSRVPMGDEAALAREAARLLDDPALWRARRDAGLAAARRFSIDRVVDLLEGLFAA
jgi:glycosyltransferase involved in cell wall biosynthesis